MLAIQAVIVVGNIIISKHDNFIETFRALT